MFVQPGSRFGLISHPSRNQTSTTMNAVLNTPKGNKLIFSFADGARLEIEGNKHALYHVEFRDTTNDVIVYQTNIDKQTDSVYWCITHLKYFFRWHLVVTEDGIRCQDYRFDITGKKIWIQFDSSALGDTLAWIPYVEEFRKKHQCELHVRTFHNLLFESSYPDLIFHSFDDNVLPTCYAGYKLGVFDNNYAMNKNNWRTVPLQQVAADFLGLPYHEIRPKIIHSPQARPIPEKYVAIAEFSTFDCKEWLRPNGWQDIVDHLNAQGYKVMSVSKEPTYLNNVIKANEKTIFETINNIQHAEFFIGISSGCSWISWALEVPVILISGCTAPFVEMKDCYRIINQTVCNSCMSDKDASFDRGNRRLCPRNKNFECTTDITQEMVIAAIERLIQDKNNPKTSIEIKPSAPRILFITPHCSTGGLPQYLLASVRDLRNSGCEVSVIEYQDIAPIYNVQKKQLQKICNNFYTLNDDRHRQIESIIQDFDPNIIHLEEFPEYFLPDETINIIYDPQRRYKIFETTHGMCVIPPEKKRYKPDQFIFVSNYHITKFAFLGVPMRVAEYQVIQQTRPNRTQALSKLGLDPNRYHILNVGLFTPGKNQAEVFNVARQLPEVQFHFVGNQAGNFEQYWKPLLRNKPDNCVIWGERDDVDLFYSACDVFYFASTFELFPIVIKEALSWNMPILMRNLETYCGCYDNNNLITFINGNVENTIAKLRSLFPTLGNTLLNNYTSIHQQLVQIENVKPASSTNKSVAVVIPNLNMEKTLERTILSAKNQTIPAKEIIVVDGGSTDNSEEIAKRHNVKWMHNPEKNQGPGKNLGFASTDCEFVVPLDSDDWIEPEYIELCLEKMTEGVGVVCTQLEFTDGNRVGPDEPFVVHRLTEKNRLFSCSMVRRTAWEQVGGFYLAPPKGCWEDWDLWLRIAEAGWKFEIVQQPLFHFTSRGVGVHDSRYTPVEEMRFNRMIKWRHLERMKAANAKTNVIVFSKDRPAQLDLLLKSIKTWAKWIERLTVIYKYSDENFDKGYQNVQIVNPKATFIKQDKPLKTLLLENIDPNKQQTMMLVDDDVFFDDLPLLEVAPGTTFSPRLGKNCTYCYTHDRIQKEGELDFVYTTSLDGNIYRTNEILSRIQAVEFETPNQLEAELAKGEPFKMYYNPHSCLVGIPNNVVQTDFANRSEGGNVQNINNTFLTGGRLHINPRDFSYVRGVHQNIPYKWKPFEDIEDTSKLRIKEILYSVKNPTVIELGAYNGLDTAWIYEACVGTPKYLAVEPDPKHYLALCVIYGIIPIETAITSFTGDITFRLSKSSTGDDHSSSIRLPKDVSMTHPNITFNETIKVPCMTLDDLTEKYEIKHVDLLFVDIQGAEKDMVLGGEKTLKNTEWIFIEAYENEMYEGQAVRSELLKMLSDFEVVEEFKDSNLLLRRKR